MKESMFKRFYNYRIYPDGKIYSEISKKFLAHDITKIGYHQVTLFINCVPVRYKVHRLVALQFVDNPDPLHKRHVNHVDGDKNNNHYSNLEWVTVYENNLHARITGLNDIRSSNSNRWKNPDFRKRVSNNISKSKILSGCAKGSKNPNFRYRIVLNGVECSRKDLFDIVGDKMSSTTIDKYIKIMSLGIKPKAFENFDIIVIDTKTDKVNRLSNDTLF